MKLKRLVKRLEAFLDADSRGRREHRDDMKKLLKKMKLKEKSLAEKALGEFDEERLRRLRKEIEMVHAQRKKGVDALKKLSGNHESGD